MIKNTLYSIKHKVDGISDSLSPSKENILQGKVVFDDDEDARLKEVPELNEKIKLMYYIKP